MRIFLTAMMLGGMGLGMTGVYGLSQSSSAGSTQTAPSASSKKSELPDGPGKEVVQRMCVGCHGLSTVTSKRATPDEWASIVDLMVSRGADGSDEDIDKVVKYLSASFPPAKPATPPAAAPKQ